MRVIRVVLGDAPRLLREIIEGAVKRHPDFEVLRSNDADLSRTAAERHADAAIVGGAADPAARFHRSILVDNPDLKIFVLTEDGRSAYLLELQQTALVDVSPSGLTGAIRAAVGRQDSRSREQS